MATAERCPVHGENHAPTDECFRTSMFGCADTDCLRHPSKGDTITRISPKGLPFVGLCDEHLDDVQNERR